MAKKILLVEDERTLRDMYSLKLTKEGYEVTSAEDGEQAIELAKSSKPDLILLDVILPKIDGFAVLDTLRKTKNFAKTPIIMLTNLGQKEDLEKGKNAGATDYLIKADTTPAGIAKKVEEVVGK